MAKTAEQKAKGKALRAARKDGKITNKEARSLQDLGIKNRQIKSTQDDTVAVGGKVNKALKPKPQSTAPTASSKPSPSQQIQNFSQDGSINAKEARQLIQSGVTLQDLKFNSNATLDKGVQNSFRAPVLDAQAATRADNNADRTAQYKDPTGLGISRKELFAMQAQTLGGPQKWSSQSGSSFDGDQGWYPNEGQINYAMYGGKEYVGQQKTAGGGWGKVAKSLGIRTIDNEKDLARMFNFVNGASTGATVQKGGSGNNGLADRTSGEFGDIQGALGEDAQAGRDAAEGLNNQEVGGEISPWQAVIDDLLATNSDSEARFDETIGNLTSGFDDTLATIAENNANSIAGLNDLFIGQYGALEDRMTDQQNSFNSAQAFTNQQLSTAQDALLREQQRTVNLGNAYVPQANPTAFSVGYGDGRSSRRKQTDNQLSDLTLLNGLGTQQNPLAGLQLA
jgi:hypothetical protein